MNDLHSNGPPGKCPMAHPDWIERKISGVARGPGFFVVCCMYVCMNIHIDVDNIKIYLYMFVFKYICMSAFMHTCSIYTHTYIYTNM